MAGAVSYEYNITIIEGGTYDKEFRWIVNDETVSLLNYSGLMQIRQKITDTSVLLELPFIEIPWVADGISGIYLVNVGIEDKYKIYINDEDTTGLCINHKSITCVYTLFLYNAFGESVLKQFGNANIIASGMRKIL